jgi:hypothetical protein
MQRWNNPFGTEFPKVVMLMRERNNGWRRGANSSVQDTFIFRFIRKDDRGLSRGHRGYSGGVFEKRFFQKDMQRWIMSFWRIMFSKVVILIRNRDGNWRRVAQSHEYMQVWGFFFIDAER